MDWTGQLLEQLTFYWERQARPRLEGLSDAEYLWEPVAGMWSVRPRDQARTALAAGAGDLVIDFEHPEPVPAPMTTIAWRLGHVTVGVFGMRTASHFGGPPMDYGSITWPADADSALALLDDVYARWVEGARSLDEDGLAQPVGAAEGPYAAAPYSALFLHLHLEVIHHLAEVALLRDLYAHTAR